MKKTTKRFTETALAVVMGITALTGCSESSDEATGKNSSAESITATGSQEIISSNEDINSTADNVPVSEDYKNITVDTKLKFMAWYDMQEAAPSVELFKAMYGTPGKKPEGYESVADENVFVNIRVTNYSDRYFELARSVQADESPDIFPFEISNYPYGIYQKLFQPIDGVIDTTTEDWAEYKPIIDMFNWGGKTYTPVFDVSPATLLWYKKSVIEEAGFDDPWELFEKGKWTWSKFLEMARKFTDPDNGKYAIDGYGFDDAFIASTGTPLISIEDGKLVSNLDNANIEKCMDMLRLFDDTQEQLRYPREIINNWTPSYNEWVNGNTLFFEDGTWRYEETFRLYKNKYNWDDDQINFVPFPRMDGSDAYYHEMYHDSFMLVAGSKNIEGYKAWIYANLLTSKDEAVKAAERQQSIDEFGWTEELLDRLDALKEPAAFSAVFEFKNGIGTAMSVYCGDNIINHLTADVVMYGESFATVREKYRDAVEETLKMINASIE